MGHVSRRPHQHEIRFSATVGCMDLDDWGTVGFAAVGAISGALIGYRIRLRRKWTPTEARRLSEASKRPLAEAVLVGLAAFAGCALAEDLGAWLRGPKAGFVFAKYIFAVALGVPQYLFLRRLPNEQGTDLSD